MWLFTTFQFNCFFLFLFAFGHSVGLSNNNTLIIIVSFDGFRYDYVDRNLTSTLNSLISNSSHALYMNSVFPSKTFTNHFSIATGLYSEVHGVLDNVVYDQLSNKSLSYGYELFHYNSQVVPIWTLNERSGGGRHSGCMMWAGCDFKYQDTTPSHLVHYNGTVAWQERVDVLLSWFKDPERPINLGMIYFEQPDLIAHSYGPNSEQVNEQIVRVDKIVQYFFEKAEEADLLSRLNFIFLSDHGAQAVKYPNNMIKVEQFVDKSWYIRDGVPPNLQIYPVKGKEEVVLNGFRKARNQTGGNFSTFTREEMLDLWHYKYCKRTPPILLTADPGFLFTTDKHYPIISPEIGTHGYDPTLSTMRGFFLATGPLFKRNHIIGPFENINIYPLVAHVLGLDLPTLRPNGSFHVLEDILFKQPKKVSSNYSTYLAAGLVIGAVFVIALTLWLVVHRIRKQQVISINSPSASYKVLTQLTDDERSSENQETLSSDCEDTSPT